MHSVIGNTSLIRLNKVSDETGCEILAKTEFMNPGGSIYDRTALEIIRNAEQKNILNPNDVIVEATTENFGVSLSLLCNSLNYKCCIIIPENEDNYKIKLMQKYGSNLIKVPVLPITDENHYTKIPEKLVDQYSNIFWCNYLNNPSNREAHYNSTGQELWRQTDGKIDAWVCSTKSGGTFAGVSSFLKEKNSKIKCVIADSHGSIIYNWATLGEKTCRDRDSSVLKEVGNYTITTNLNNCFIDDAVKVSDQECIDTMHQTLWSEGLFLGESSGVNIFAATRIAEILGPGHTIVTVLSDDGERYLSSLYDEEWLKSKKLLMLDKK